MPRPALPALLAGLAFTVTPALSAPVAVPSPSNSTLPSCFVACPLGDIHIVATIRDLANVPAAGSMVVLDFSGCAGANVCASSASDPYVYDPVSRTIRMAANGAGNVDFPLRVGGGCGTGGVRMFADGVLMSSYALVSPDQTGNGVVLCIVGDNDCAAFVAKLGTADPSADWDCDGDVDNVDGNHIVAEHYLHSCDGVVPTRHDSWGRLKSLYR